MWILQVAADEPDLIRIVRDFWLRWPSKKPYNLDAPEKEDFSMGQSLVVDSLLKHKVPNKFLNEYYLFLVTFPMAFKARVGSALFALWRQMPCTFCTCQRNTYISIGSSMVRGGGGATNIKYKGLPMAAIFFMTSFNRDRGGHGPLGPSPPWIRSCTFIGER